MKISKHQLERNKNYSRCFYPYKETFSSKMDVVKLKQSFTRYDVRTVIKFLLLLEKTPIEIHNNLLSALGDNSPTITTVRRWVKEIQEGRTNVEDERRPGRPVTACGDATIGVVKSAVEEDKRKTARELSK